MTATKLKQRFTSFYFKDGQWVAARNGQVLRTFKSKADCIAYCDDETRKLVAQILTELDAKVLVSVIEY